MSLAFLIAVVIISVMLVVNAIVIAIASVTSMYMMFPLVRCKKLSRVKEREMKEPCYTLERDFLMASLTTKINYTTAQNWLKKAPKKERNLYVCKEIGIKIWFTNEL